MLIIVHFLVGAAMVHIVKPLYLALILAFLSHYLLDALPHTDYPGIKNIEERGWKKARPEFIRIAIKVSLEIFIGISLIFILSNNFLAALLGAIAAALPDSRNILNIIFPKNRFLIFEQRFHSFAHWPENKKIPFPLGILSQIVMAILAIWLLL